MSARFHPYLCGRNAAEWLIDMFRRKNDKRIVELNPEELRLAKYALLGFRNKLVAQGKPTEDVNALLLKIMK